MIIQHCGFCGSSDSRMIKTTSRDELLAEYKKMYGLSFPQSVLESNFGFSVINTYRCMNCGTGSYHPNILGNALFYEYLCNNLPWYYSESRWEFPIALEILDKEKPRLFLEVGCGDGHFLNLARKRGYEGYGYETNPLSVKTLNSRGFHTLPDLNQDKIEYDALLMFQTLEHLIDPFSFLQSILPYVQSSGILVISTPVMPSCASFNSNALLLPPHHQWLPTASAYKYLADRLDLVCENVVFDPPSVFQVEYALKKQFGKLPQVGRLAALILKVARVVHCDWAEVGHAVLVVLRKKSQNH